MSLDIQQLKREVGIEDVLLLYGGSVPSRGRTGYWISMSCPFHADNVESASVNVGKERFRCHACDIHGDIVDVVKQYEMLGTREAVAWIAEQLNIS